MKCTCGHDASEHSLVDHDATAPHDAEWRRGQKLPRWHWVCSADVHPEGVADSPWDHVCGCLHSVWDHEEVPTIDPRSVEVKPLLREALGEHEPA